MGDARERSRRESQEKAQAKERQKTQAQPSQEERPKGNPRNQRKIRPEQKTGTSVVCKASVIFVLSFFSLQVAENEVILIAKWRLKMFKRRG